MLTSNLLKKTTISFVLATSLLASTSYVDTKLLRQPSISRDHLAFVYGGDIWLADRDGKNPTRVTQHPVAEFAPTLSPDGKWLAFSASYDRNTDVYVMPVSGDFGCRIGAPSRYT